jgi:hypothetical protein
MMSVIEINKQSLVNPSSTVLDMHLAELEEECARFISLTSTLRSMLGNRDTINEEERASIEAELYASLSHLSHHVQPAINEMSRLLDEMPDEEDDSTEL